ncbi:MAG TPA: peptidoglycan DD-metalloendopeptidase family protein, partial [Solirubrobacteraceae bacterium]|nr:peptidoglycan DD-metalloendopeptidase family protein [Solirubrobacteraceae bacterium]
MDSRPSELDPYPRADRDLGSAVLWQRSLHRSSRRRIRARDARRNAPRQKGATLAAGAAILASPVLSPLTGAASASSARPGATKAEVAQKAAVSGEKTWLLSYGDTGEAVTAVQYQLRIPADGIFGPQTEGAVKTFQINNGLAGTGIVDAKTWAQIFGSKVTFYGEADASTAPSTGEAVKVVLGSDAPEATGGPDLEDRVELRDEIEDSSSDSAPPAPSSESEEGGTAPAQPVEQTAPVSTGDGCTSDGRMVAPVNGTVTGSFGEDRGSHAHSGTDIAAPSGTTVRAAECGTISVSGTESGYGNMVCIQHAGETTTCYAHLSERSVGVNEYVKAGQKIGEVGCTGSCTGPHVHFEVRQNGAAQDPSPYLQGSKTTAGATAQATSAPLPEGDGGSGGATPQEQEMVFGSTGGAEAPPAEATTTTEAAAAAPIDEA